MRKVAPLFSVLLLRCGTLALALVVVSPDAQAAGGPMRYQNFHGSTCQTANSTMPHAYSSDGVTIPPGQVSPELMCPVSWSLDATTSQMQEISFTVSWSGVVNWPFDPGCTFVMNTSSVISSTGHFTMMNPTVIGPNTSTPTFVYSWTTGTTPLIFYENVIGSLLYCAAVPPGVTLNGYSIITCVSKNLTDCSPI